MRFQNTTAAQFPTPASVNASAFGFDGMSITKMDPRSGTKRATVDSPSGASAIVIPGSRRLRVLLKQLVFSWAGITAIGHFEIRSPTTEPLIVYQSGNSGQVIIPCFDEDLFLGRYGLRAQNNSVNGDYAINAYYDIVEV